MDRNGALGLLIYGMKMMSEALQKMAELLTLSQAISVIMGANIGTTLTAWIMSLGYNVDLTSFVFPAFFFGTVNFDPVSTKALRLEIVLPTDNSAGLFEWSVR